MLMTPSGCGHLLKVNFNNNLISIEDSLHSNSPHIVHLGSHMRRYKIHCHIRHVLAVERWTTSGMNALNKHGATSRKEYDNVI